MALRKNIKISVVFADAAYLRFASIHGENHYLDIHILESPDSKSSHWQLSVSESIMRKDTQWTAILSVEESERFITLLQKIPAQSMVSTDGMFDGSETEMLVIHKEQTISFKWELPPWETLPWQNIPSWRLPPKANLPSPAEQETKKEIWVGIGAVVDFIFQAIEKYRNSTS